MKSLALSAHVSPQTIHFRVLDESPVSGPGRAPPSCNKWRLWWGLFFAETDILTTRGTRASLPANGPDPAAATGTLLSLVFWCGQLARVPRPVRNKRLHWPLSLPLSFLCLALPILPPLPSPPVLDPGIWSKGLSLSWGLETDHLLLAENSN